MACETYAGGVTVCSGPRRVARRHLRRCWNCDTTRRVVQVFAGCWYPSTFYCCHCGDGWGDGERLPRPFARGWREKSIARAKRYWGEAMTPAAFQKAVRDDLQRYMADEVENDEVEDVVGDL